MTFAERFARWLEAQKITHAFGIVGGGDVVLWDAITRHGYTQLISTHHEQAAVMAAYYYWRVSGRMALALVTTGGGSTNALTGVMAAWMDSAAVLVVSGNESSAHLRGETRVLGAQGYHADEVAAPMVKFAADITDTLWLDYAYARALAPRAGPVWVNIAKDAQSAVGK